MKPEKIVINIRGFDRETWQMFKAKCAILGVPMVRQLEKLLADYNNRIDEK